MKSSVGDGYELSLFLITSMVHAACVLFDTHGYTLPYGTSLVQRHLAEHVAETAVFGSVMLVSIVPKIELLGWKDGE
jgi:hypothetical protein